MTDKKVLGPFDFKRLEAGSPRGNFPLGPMLAQLKLNVGWGLP